MKHVLITGATGFTGSALAACFLARSMRVVALVRNDPDGSRTKKAVYAAAEGYGFELAPDLLSGNLQVVEGMDALPNPCMDSDLLASIDEVWHVAAEMSTRDNMFCTALDVNVTKTVALYQQIAHNAPECRRFYFVSSAYVAYEPGNVSTERLYCTTSCLSPYLFSKQCAEQALAFLSRRDTLPVSIIRPSFITGHETSGWIVRNGLSLYAAAEIMKAAKRCGAKVITIPARPEVRLDLLPINRLTDQAMALSERRHASGMLEILHSRAGLDITVADIFGSLSELLSVEVRFGQPRTALEKDISALMLEINAQDVFNLELAFDDTMMRQAVGECAKASPLGRDVLARLFAWYLAEDF